MAFININIEEEPISPLNYNSYSVGVATACNSSASQREFAFNILSSDFVVGKDYNNGLGYPAQTLRVLNFTDNSYFIENSTGNQTPAPGFIPKRLRNLVTNTTITTFPYEILISNINQLGVELGGNEMICPSDPINYSPRRVRELTYRILDNQGNVGPIKIATFSNLPQ